MPSGFLDVTPGAVSEAQRNAILARKLNPERIQPRHNNFPHLRQFTVHQVENQATLYYVLNQIQGTTQPYVAYTPEALFGRSPHNGVTVPLPDLDSGSHTITYRWTIPSSNDPVLVDVQPTDLREPEIAYQTILPTGANEIQVDFNLSVSTEGQGSVQGEVLLNGQHLTNLNVASSAVNVMPLFRRARSGLYHLTVHHNGELLVDEAYVQRELAWEQPWPSIETGDVETPIPFSNTLVWKVDDQTFPTAEDQPRWRARFPGALFPPSPSSGSSQPYQSGSSVSFTWLPSSLEIVLSRARSELGRFKLIPSDALEPGEEGVQARAPETTYSYSVEGQAVTYDSFTPVARQTVSAAGLVPAKMRQVYIENARFEPSPPDPEQPSVFRADVQSYFFEDPQIKWTLQIESDDQGTTVRAFEQADWLDLDESFQIQVPWDRTDDQGQPSTGNHRATLRVWVQEKTLTNPNGTHPQVLAEETVDYFVPGTKTLELDYLFSEPPSLESGQVGPVTLIPYAIIRGFPTPPEVSWSITIEVPGLGDQIFQGANNQDFFEASWEAAGADGGALPDGVYTVQVRAEIASEGLVAEKSFPYSIGAGQTVLVENLTGDPNPVDFEEQPEGMKGAHFRADLTPIGFEEPVTVRWTLEIREPGIEDPVRSMTGQIALNAAGQTEPTRFETFWDGLDSSSQLLVPGQYEVALIVDPCAGEELVASSSGHGGASTFSASGSLQSESLCTAGRGALALSVGPSLRVEVLPVNEDPPYPGGALALASSDRQDVELQERLLKEIHSFGSTERVKVRLWGVVPGADQVAIKVAAYQSNRQGATVSLRQNEERGFYEGTLEPAALLRPAPTDSFTTIDLWQTEDYTTRAHATADSRAFRAWAGRTGLFFGHVEAPRLEPGDGGLIFSSLVTGYAFGEAAYEDNDKVIPTADSIRAAGYEVLRFTYRDHQADLRIKSQAENLYYSGHGRHQTNTLEGQVQDPILITAGTNNQIPDDGTINASHWSSLKGIIFAGCSACDLNDYNGFFARKGESTSFQPMLEWQQVTGGRATIVGYANKAPTGNKGKGFNPFRAGTDEVVILGFMARIGTLSNYSAWPMAWLEVNSKVDLLDGAAALHGGSYYFIEYKETTEKLPGNMLRIFHTERFLMRIPQDQWGLPDPASHKRTPLSEKLPDTVFETEDH